MKAKLNGAKLNNIKSVGRIGKIGIVGISLILLFLPLSLRTADLEAKDAAEVLKKVVPSVVKVEVSDGVKRVATGVVIDGEGLIATTALISPRREKIAVRTYDGRTLEAKYLGLDPVTRLALLQVKEKELKPIATGQAKEANPGQWVAVVSISPENSPAITQGIISSVGEDRIRLNISVLPGASGSPVVNEKGEMLGLLRGPYAEGQPVVFEFREREIVGSGYVIGRGETPASGIAVAVPIEMVKKVAAEIKEKGRAERGWLGVSLIEDESSGRLRIGDVVKGSPAEQAGLKEDDILLKINDREITDAEMFAREIRNRRPGEEVRLEIERKGKKQEIKAKLGAYPAEEAQRELEARWPEFFRSFPLVRPERPTLPREAPRSWERRRYIGIYPEEIGRELADYFGVKEGRGLLITRLEPDSPAEKAGLKVGDVVVRADGERVESIDSLSSLLQQKKKGDKIKLEIVRDKKTLVIEVEVGEEERGVAFFSPGWTEFFRDLEKRQRELQESLKKMQEEQSLRARESLKKIMTEMERAKEEYSLRLKEYQEKAKEYQEKIKEKISKKIIIC